MLYRYLRTAIKLGSQQTVNDDIIDTYKDNSFYQTDINIYNDQSLYKHQYNLIKDNMIHDYSFQLNDRIVAASEGYRTPDIEIKEGEEFQIGEDKYLIEIEENDNFVISTSDWENGTFNSSGTANVVASTSRIHTIPQIYLPSTSRSLHTIPNFNISNSYQEILVEINSANSRIDGRSWSTAQERTWTAKNDTQSVKMLLKQSSDNDINNSIINNYIFSMEGYKSYIMIINKNNEVLEKVYLFATQIDFNLGINSNYQIILNITTPESFSKAIILGDPITYTLDNTIYEVKDTNINSSNYPIYTDYSDS